MVKYPNKANAMKRILVLLVVLVIGSIIAVLWWQSSKEPVDTLDKSEKIFIIHSGKGVREVASDLKKENLIKDPVFFFLFVKMTGKDRQIQAGDYKLSPSMNVSEIVDNLMHGTLDIWITIPEGRRSEEISEIFKNILSNYSAEWVPVLKENEGYLFPDTYLIPTGAGIEQIVEMMKNNFEKKYKTIPNSDTTDLTRQEIVIIASMVEREAKFKEDRPLVASVIINRLKLGMKLDIDATLQYMLGYQEDEKRWWKEDLTVQDKEIDSPFNTYLYAGLPPTPISNPGHESIEGVINHETTDYLYYVSDSMGKNHYARTIAEHNKNIDKYIRK